jgi:hypothetical protein
MKESDLTKTFPLTGAHVARRFSVRLRPAELTHEAERLVALGIVQGDRGDVSFSRLDVA